MAIDFSQVNTITIPEASVKKITDSNGNTLWQGVGWHTIWDGSKTCSAKVMGSATPVITGNENNFTQTAIGTGYTPKIRITFSYSIDNKISDWEKRFYINNKRDTIFPTSPLIIDQVKNTSNNKLCGPSLKHYSNVGPDARVVLNSDKDAENNRIILSLKAVLDSFAGYVANFTITLTVTKIEQYY